MITTANYKSMINPENLELIKDEEDELFLVLQKLYDWQEEYSMYDISWPTFRDRYHKCIECGGYSDDFCICYAR